MEKSHVSIEQNLCIVTGKPFDTGGILLDKRLEQSLNKHTITNYGISPEVQEKIDEGYIPVVAIDPEKSEFKSNGNIDPEKAYRTGKIAYMKKEFLKQFVNISIDEAPFLFSEEEAINELNKIYLSRIKENKNE